MDSPEWTQPLRDSLYRLVETAVNYLPAFLSAVLLVVAGWLIAWLLQVVSGRLLRALDWLLGSHSIEGALKRVRVKRSAADVLGSIVFWAVFLFFLGAATEALGLPVLATWLSGLSYYLPRILVGLLIIFAGLVAASLARDAVSAAVQAAGVPYAVLIGHVTHGLIVLITLITAAEQIGIDTGFLTLNISIVIGALLMGTALAFGLGARTSVSNIIGTHYLRQSYQVGQTIEVGDTRGRIREITRTAVVLETDGGLVTVPAKIFSELSSTLVTVDG